MKFLTFKTKNDNEIRFGFKSYEKVIDIGLAAKWLYEKKNDNSFINIPLTLHKALEKWDQNFRLLKALDSKLSDFNIESFSYKESDLTILPPIINPPAFRDFYAFEQHVKAARKLRKLDMHPDWYKIPIFYFSNPNCCYGHGENIPYPNGTTELDFELEFAVIIGNGGSNINSSEANKVIAGYTILNDWSSRNLQREEMPMSLGPAKGKDFASSFGPYMVTPDEIESAWKDDGKLHLQMTCHVNGKKVSDGNTNDLYHSFGDMIERASMNTKLIPGEYIGSGTVGTGCILELRPENAGGWLKKGDIVTLEIERLGILENKIV
ncbi:MAG: fumarylacetoacetate hydrolase family protein [Candidatus Neomarinimicrobiota bacterium]|tara:strand:- start:897 stop:1862 length:966 start_codon:yes stop_codon:yes gene_type:complete